MCLTSNSVDIIAVRLVKQGIETGRFRAVQPVQPLHMLKCEKVTKFGDVLVACSAGKFRRIMGSRC